MSEQMREAGKYELASFKIISYDGRKTFEIAPIIQSFEIHESMKRGSVRGFAKMFDSVGLLQDFPLRGEEFIEITYRDFYDNEHTDKMFLYAISDVRRPVENNPSRWEYTIHFVSRPKIFNENIKVMRAFSGPPENRAAGGLISDFVETLYDEFYGKDIDSRFWNNPELETEPKEFIVQPTDGMQRLVVPNYTPEQAMNFFARRAYNASSFSQTFHFFENRKNYVFGTNEYSTDQIARRYGVYKFSQDYKPSFNPDDQLALQNSIIGIDYGEVVNSIEDISGGGFVRKTYEVDLLYNIISETKYEHLRDFYTNNPKQRPYHTDRFINERLTKEYDRWVVKDYSNEGMPTGPGIRLDTKYPEIYNKKGTHLYHTNKNKTICTIYGSNKIFAGSLIDLEIFKHTSDDDLPDDLERSGEFMVESIENIFYEDVYIQKLTLTRNGVGD
jgi:hypothetical protein